MKRKIPVWIWIVAGIVICLTIIQGLSREFKGMQRFSEGESEAALAITLPCGTGFRRLPQREKVTVVVPPSPDCWSDYLVRPVTATAFWIQPDGPITEERAFGGGETKLVEDTPISETVEERKLTGVRFKNGGSAPVTVRIRLN